MGAPTDGIPQGDAGAQPSAGSGLPMDAAVQYQSAVGYGQSFAAPMTGAFSTATADSTGINFSSTTDAGTSRPGEGAAQNLEMPTSKVTEASDEKSANLVINEDGSSTWNKPVGPPNYETSIFRKAGASSDDVAARVQEAKDELALGQHVQDGKKVNLDTSNLPESLTKESTGKDSKESADPKEDSPEGGSGGGGCNKGGGKEQDPADDKTDPAEKEEGKTDPEGVTEPAEKTSQTTSLRDDIKDNIKANVNAQDQARNVASFGGSLWNSSPMMSNLFSKYDADGDGKLDADEMAAMEKDPDYAKASKEMQDKVGDDPSMKDFKDKIGTREGLNDLASLANKDASGTATAADTGRLFNGGAQSSIMERAVSQQLKAAGADGSETLPSDATAAQEAAYKAKISTVVDKLINGKHIFSF